MNYTLGSLFDGSGGFPLAGSLCGIEPRWASEVEPYPIAVTRSRFPNMKHLGDISKIHGGEIEPVDVITFGSPCQDLSVAGKRAGLKHEANGDEETTRSGLFMEAVRIIKEMREATNGKYPTFALWENVPGAFTSNKGEDFRIVCEELIKIIEPAAVMPPVPKNGWPYADSYVLDGGSLAYRVFDAQHWGVPQRRRRIHLIADFTGTRARKVLFERDGVRRYYSEGRTPSQTVASDAQGCTGADDCNGEIFDQCKIERFEDSIGFDCYNITVTGDKSMTVTSKSSDAHHVPSVVYSFDSLSSNSMKSANPHSGCRDVEVAKTLDTTYPDPSKNQGGIAVVEVVSIHDQATRFSGKRGDRTDDKDNGLGVGNDGDPMTTLTSGDRHAVSYQKICGSICSRDYKGVGNEYIDANKVVVDPTSACRIIRRLTPTECARLQGFADWWGHIDPKDTFTDEEYKFWLAVRNTHSTINGKEVKDYTVKQMLTWYNKLWTDGAEYKMWGNGIALPPALYCMQGIADALAKVAVYESNDAYIQEQDVKNESMAEATDLSDAPDEIKEKIIENDKILQSRESVCKEEMEEEKMEEIIHNDATEANDNVVNFDAKKQLVKLAAERKALANLNVNSDRFADDVRAIEYAISVLEAVGL